MIRLAAAIRARRDRTDRGAVIVLFGLILFSLLVVTAIVVDLGYARATRREAQTNVDLAAVAAGYNLAGGGSPGLQASPRAACESALNSLLANYADLPSTTTMNPLCSTLPTTVSVCTPSYAKRTLVSTASDPYRVTIEWPVNDTDIADTRFNGLDGGPSRPGVGSQDGDRCERMRVSINRQNEVFFAGVMGNGGEVVRASATVKASASGDSLAVPALLLLERKGCRTLEVSGSGAVQVKSTGDVFGVIHSDTAGQVGDTTADIPCTTNTNANGYGIYGTARPASVGGGPSIIADGNGSRPGRIAIYALSPGIAGRGGYRHDGEGDADNGLNVAPSAGRVISRMPVDRRYNDPGDATKQYIRSTHNNGIALTLVRYVPSTSNDPAVVLARLMASYSGPAWCVAADAQCWKVISGAQCSQGNVVYQGRNQGPVPGAGADNYYVLCNEFTGSNVVFRNGLLAGKNGNIRWGRVVFGGKVSVSGNSCAVITTDYGRCTGYLAIPNADEVFVRGCVSSCNGSGDFAIKSTGLIALNQGEDLVLSGLGGNAVTRPDIMNTGAAPPDWPWLNCTKYRNGPGDGGLYGEWTKLASFGRRLTVQNGTLSWCQTSYYLGYDRTNYSAQQIVTGGNCTATLPCPADTPLSAPSLLEINSGPNPPVAWQAPNQTDTGPGVTSNLEDLALWTEGGGDYGTCVIAGQGAMQAGGIFFHPNCRLSYGGQTDNDNPLNAQFIGRSLDISGQGVLRLKPSAKDAVQVRVGGDVLLIR